MRRGAVALCGAALIGCWSPAPRSGDAGLAAASDAAPSAPAPASTPLQSALRIVASEGAVTGLDSDALDSGPRAVRVARGGQLQLGIGDHTRLTVQGPATVQLVRGGQPALLLREGVVMVDAAAPVQAATAPALWIASPTAWVEVAQRARFVMHATARASVLAIASGVLRVRLRDSVQDLVSGDATSCLSAGTRWPHARLSGKLEQRAQRIARLPPCARRAGEPADAQLADELAQLLTRHEAAQARTRATLATHARLAGVDPHGAAAQQRALAQQAATVMQLEDELRARRSVLAARTLGTPPTAIAELLTRALAAAP